MAIEKKPRISLGDTTPPPALAQATEEKDYYTARIPKSFISKVRQAQHRDGFKHGWEHFMHVMTEHLKKNHPDLL
jgi:hypothetical protein